MINLTLLKHIIKANWRLWLFFTGTMAAILIFVMSLLYLGGVEKFISVALPEFHSVIGMGLYAGPFILISMIYTVVLVYRLVVEPLETKTMSYYLSTQNSRQRVITTQGYFLVLSLFFMILSLSLLGLFYNWIWGSQKLEISIFLLLNVGLFCLQTSISGISFLVACISRRKKHYYWLGVGLPVLFSCISVLEYVSGMTGLRFLTPLSLYSPEQIVRGSIHICWRLPLLALTGLILYQVGVRRFERRDLAL